MKKIVTTISLAAALSVITATPFSASAAISDPANTSDYVQSIQLDRYALTAEEAASGDAGVHASVYVKGTTKDSIKVQNALCQIVSEDKTYTYMRNIYDPSFTYDEQTYSYLGGEFTTAYRPFCFGVVDDGTYSIQAVTTLTRRVCMEPIDGKEIVYMGNDTIKFKQAARRYVDENGNMAPDNVSHDIICPLTINEDGSATYSFKYVDIYATYSVVATATGVIPYYQPELLNEGDYIPDTNDILSWVDNPLYGGVSFLGNSDDFPLMENDIKFKPDSPCGIYNLSLNEDYCNISALENGESCVLPVKYTGAAVAVGVDTAELSSSEGADYACYYAHDNKTITAATMGKTYSCNVAYTDGTSETAVDVSGAVNAGTSPADIMSAQEDSFYIADIPVYCGDTQITSDGTDITSKVLIGTKGDVDLNGKVDLSDASVILSYYASKAAGSDAALTDGSDEELETLAFFLGDTDTQSQTRENGGQLDLTDASNILSYYASTAAGITISWDQFLE